MPYYRVAKTAELDLLFDWLAKQLRRLRQAHPDQRVLLGYLDQEYKQAENSASPNAVGVERSELQ